MTKAKLLNTALLLLSLCLHCVAEAKETKIENQGKCLAIALYYEARGESERGQKAVADVIIQRSLDKGMSVCRVLTIPNQFSWRAALMWRPYPEDSLTQQKLAYKIMDDVAHKKWKSSVNGATYFHSGKKPKWAKRLIFIKKIDKHYFYKEKK